MNKFLPLILLLLGIVVVVSAFFVVKGRQVEVEEGTEEERLVEIPLERRPVASLTPTSDGHFLDMRIEKLMVDAVTLDYELLYHTGAGIFQGVPGTISLAGIDSFENQLLLGSESAGKYRFDEGVEEGSLTLGFRDLGGKLISRLRSEFHLQTNTSTLSSLDGNFVFHLERASREYFVVMNTFGVPANTPTDILHGPYGVFSSGRSSVEGRIESEGSVYFWNGDEWALLADGQAQDAGIFYISSD